MYVYVHYLELGLARNEEECLEVNKRRVKNQQSLRKPKGLPVLG